MISIGKIYCVIIGNKTFSFYLLNTILYYKIEFHFSNYYINDLMNNLFSKNYKFIIFSNRFFLSETIVYDIKKSTKTKKEIKQIKR